MGLVDLISEGNCDVPEQHCFEKLNCKRYTPDKLKSIKCKNDHSYSLMHLNTRSLNKHYDDFLSLLASLDHRFDVIGCSETWITDKSYLNILNLNGYVLYNRNRSGRPGGGVCLYINSLHSVSVCDDLNIDDGYSDSLFVEININNGKNIIVGVIYRPPDSDLNSFKLKLDELLNCINRTNKNCFILGDFNIDLAKENSAKNDFMNTLYSSSFFPHYKYIYKRNRIQ